MNRKPVPEITELSKPHWDGMQRGELLIQRCADCGAWVFYPSHWCTRCYGQNLPWTACSGRGEVYSFSVVHYPPYESFAEVPYVLATIELEEGVHMMTNVVNCDWRQVKVGMKVKMTLEERAGGFKVPQFEPA